MVTTREPAGFLLKALLSLQGAEREYANQCYDNCANRCYYAVFQAAVHALQNEGIYPTGSKWGHDFVRRQFENQLIHRRRIYGSGLRAILQRNIDLRRKADYDDRNVPRQDVERALRRTRDFVAAIAERSAR